MHYSCLFLFCILQFFLISEDGIILPRENYGYRICTSHVFFAPVQYILLRDGFNVVSAVYCSLVQNKIYVSEYKNFVQNSHQPNYVLEKTR